MRRYIFFILITLMYVQVCSAENNDFSNMQVITPRGYFLLEQISYYFGHNGIKSIKIINDSLIIDNNTDIDSKNKTQISLISLLENSKQVLYLEDGSLLFYNDTNDYSCKDNYSNNCLYSPIYIRKISKKNLLGKTSLHRMDKYIPLNDKNIINFPAGAEMYTVAVEIPMYNFTTFNDMDSLICSKNQDDLCRGVIINNKIDKVALFELSSMQHNGSEFLYQEVSDNLAYHFDLINNKVTPYNKKCLNEKNIKVIEKCINKNLQTGIIKQHRHPLGIIYWLVDYKNSEVDNQVFWVNKRGEPFTAYINSRKIYNFSLFNEKAIEVIKNYLAQ